MKIFQKAVLVILVFVLPSAAVSQTRLHKDVDELILAGKLEEAEITAKANLEKYPDNPEAMCALACVYRSKARKSYLNVNLAAMGIKEGETGTYILKGEEDIGTVFKDEFSYDREAYTRAETLYYKIIENHEEYLNAYFNLLNDYVTMEEFENYFKVIDLFIENLKDRNDTPDYLLDLGKKLIQGQYLDEALNLYGKMVVQFPERTEAKSDIGAVYFKKGKINRALDIFKEVYEIDKTDTINLSNYILTSLLVEDFETVFSLYKDKITLSPKEYGCWFNMGLTALLLDKDYKSYLDEFIQKHESAKSDAKNDFWFQQSSTLLDIENKSVEEKIKYFEFLSMQFGNTKMHDLALIASNIVEKFEPTNVALMIQASVFDRYNFYEKTIEYLNKISDRRKLDASIIPEFHLHFNYGRISYVAEKYDDAIAYFLKGFEIDSNSAQLNYLLGKSYLKRNKMNEAIKYFTINKNMDDKAQMEYINYSIRELGKIEAAK